MSTPSDCLCCSLARRTASIAVFTTPRPYSRCVSIDPSARADAVTMDESCVLPAKTPGRFSAGGLLGGSMTSSSGVHSTRPSKAPRSFASERTGGIDVDASRAFAASELSRRALSSVGVAAAAAHNDFGLGGDMG